MTATPDRYITTCNLCGKSVAETGTLNIPLEGDPGMDAVSYFMALKKHMDRRHPERSKALVGAVQEFGAMLLFSAFHTDEPNSNKKAELIRSVFINQFATYDSDQAIKDVVVRLELDQAKQADVIRMVCAFRDLWTQRGSYAPRLPAESPIIRP